MSASLSIDTLLDRNKNYLASHQPIPTFTELMSRGRMPVIMAVTCADPRCIPENFLSLNTGEVVTVRNAGGNIEAALPELLALDVLVKFDEIMVIKHTDCGTLAYTEEGVKGVLTERAPGRESEIHAMEFGSIAGKTLEQGLKEQVAVVKGNDLVREAVKSKVRGFIYDLTTGGLTEVKL